MPELPYARLQPGGRAGSSGCSGSAVAGALATRGFCTTFSLDVASEARIIARRRSLGNTLTSSGMYLSAGFGRHCNSQYGQQTPARSSHQPTRTKTMGLYSHANVTMVGVVKTEATIALPMTPPCHNET